MMDVKLRQSELHKDEVVCVPGAFDDWRLGDLRVPQGDINERS